MIQKLPRKLFPHAPRIVKINPSFLTTVGEMEMLTYYAPQLLSWQESGLHLPRIERETGLEDQSHLGQSDKTTWKLRGCESKIQTQSATKEFWS